MWSASNRKAFIRFVQKCRTLIRYYADVDFDAQKVERLLEEESNIQALNWLERKNFWDRALFLGLLPLAACFPVLLFGRQLFLFQAEVVVLQVKPALRFSNFPC